MGYFRDSTPLLASASYPTKLPLFSMPTITFVNFGRPTIEGNDDLGASYPLTPALHIPEPLSITTGPGLSLILLISIFKIFFAPFSPC